MDKKPTFKKSPSQIVRDAVAREEEAARREEAKNVSKKPKTTVKKVSKAGPKVRKPVPRKSAPEKPRAPRTKPDKSTGSLAGEAEPVLMTQAEAEKAMESLPMQWQLFIEFYLTLHQGKEAALRAGYAEASSADTAWRIKTDPRVVPILAALEKDQVSRVRMSRERIIDEYATMAEADSSELTEHRRVCCRHCHGEKDEETGAHAYQVTPAEFVRNRDHWDAERKAELASKLPDRGEFPYEAGNWYDKRKAINPACPECFGDGVGEVILKDTRFMSRHARSIYAGTKEGKDGIEMKMHSKESALGVLAKSRKVFDDSVTLNMNFTAEGLDAKFGSVMANAHARQEKVRQERFGLNGEPDPSQPAPPDDGQQG